MTRRRWLIKTLPARSSTTIRIVRVRPYAYINNVYVYAYNNNITLYIHVYMYNLSRRVLNSRGGKSRITRRISFLIGPRARVYAVRTRTKRSRRASPSPFWFIKNKNPNETKSSSPSCDTVEEVWNEIEPNGREGVRTENRTKWHFTREETAYARQSGDDHAHDTLSLATP